MEPSSSMHIDLSTYSLSSDQSLLHISVVPPITGTRKPTAIICCLDTSGSMNNPSNADKVDNLSVLDLVKHSVKTMAMSLNDNDYMAIIGFESKATQVLGLTKMTEAGKKQAITKVESMKPDGGTNIWDALKMAFGIIKSNLECEKINTSIWLFTDGEPNENPPSGIVASLKNLIGSKSCPCVINTFGFGYSLDSRLLYEISEIGNGIFCYVPDCNIVGTTFINCLCNTLATFTFNCALTLKSDNVSNLQPIGFSLNASKIELGTVQLGQTRDLILRYKPIEGKPAKFEIEFRSVDQNCKNNISGYLCPKPHDLLMHYCRSVYIDTVLEALSQHEKGKGDFKFLQNLENLIVSQPCKSHPYMIGMLSDLKDMPNTEGRVAKAFSTPERVKRWGSHYVRSIITAHKLQQCHNFKDPGVQFYGGKLFKELQGKADLMFCSLPPPEPSLKKQQDDIIELLKQIDPEAAAAAIASLKQTSVAVDIPPAPVDMASYNDCGGGGCFDGEGYVLLKNGEHKQVKNLLKDDEIECSDGSFAKVLCLAEFIINRELAIVEISKVKLTPKHPIKYEGKWAFPKNIEKVKSTYIHSIYNLVLDKDHIVKINGIEILTWGHEKYGNEIIEHEYYGTKKIIEDLKKSDGWEKGKIVLEKIRKIRDPDTKKVTKIIF